MESNKLYAVIGLGNFGYSIATTIANAGQDVIAIDSNMMVVEEISEHIPNAVCADCKDIELLKEAGVADADVAIVSMGSQLEASILTILHLQELGVKHIIAKANNERYKYVLEKIGADTVIMPENEMGQRVAIALINPKIIDIFNVTADYSIMEIAAPELWVRKPLSALKLREIYGVNVIGIRKENDNHVNTNFKPDYHIEESDSLVIAVDNSRIASLNLD